MNTHSITQLKFSSLVLIREMFWIPWNWISFCSQESACLELYHSAIRLQQDGDLSQAKEIYREILESELMEEVGGASQHTTLSKLKYLVYKNVAAIAREQGDLSAAVDSYIEVRG